MRDKGGLVVNPEKISPKEIYFASVNLKLKE